MALNWKPRQVFQLVHNCFFRWFALVAGGDDHLNHIIDPPGLTVMRIAGGQMILPE